MGGFTINGFGAADSYYPIKNIRTAYCSACRKEKMFALMELKRKVRVLYIPTFSVGSKYAVACSTCKNGWYVNDVQKEFILSHSSDPVQIGTDGVQFQGIENDAPKEEVPAAIAAPQPPTPQALASQPPTPQTSAPQISARICACGATVPGHGAFCPQCGKRYEAPVSQQEAPETQAASAEMLAAIRKKKICPSCRMMFPMERQTCPICGASLEEK